MFSVRAEIRSGVIGSTRLGLGESDPQTQPIFQKKRVLSVVNSSFRQLALYRPILPAVYITLHVANVSSSGICAAACNTIKHR